VTLEDIVLSALLDDVRQVGGGRGGRMKRVSDRKKERGRVTETETETERLPSTDNTQKPIL
jgi:hypothetical protein